MSYRAVTVICETLCGQDLMSTALCNECVMAELQSCLDGG